MTWKCLTVLLLALGACGPSAKSPGSFNPNNLDQLAEIYVRTNYFNDFAVMETYGLKGRAGLSYTEAIAYQARDTVRWQKFMRKVDGKRQQLAREYESKPAAGAPDAAT